MATQNTDGSTTTSDGKVFRGHNAANLAHDHEQAKNLTQVGSIFQILLLLPMVIGKLIGLVVGILLKLGLVGKIILSALLVCVGFVYSAYFLTTFVLPLPLSDNMKNDVMFYGSLVISVFLVVQFWRHGGFGATASIGTISTRIGICVCIIVFGTFISAFIAGAVSGIPIIGLILGYVFLFGPTVLAVLYWFKQVKKDNPAPTAVSIEQ
jgi:hypothetical protein